MKMKRNQNYCKKNFCKRCPGTKISLRCLGTQHVVQKESRGSVDRSEAVLGGKPREGRGEKLLVVEDFFLPGDRTVIEDQQNGYRNGS